MQIKLYPTAASDYVKSCYRHARPDCGMLHKPEWEEMLKKVEGQWLEIETDWLFADQFNTAPIQGVSTLGMRIMASSVEEIRDDIRPGMYHDRWTNKSYTEIPEECTVGERRKYLYRFAPNPNQHARGVILLEKRVYQNNA